MHKRIDFQPEQTLLFIGDSITDCERREPSHAPLGCGYVRVVANALPAAHPDLNLTIENRGIGGDSTRALKCRWNRDCIMLKPDIVSTMIGINDLWRKYSDSAEDRRMYVPPDEYETNYRQILAQLKDECGSQLVLMEPYMFCDDPDNRMLADLTDYIRTVHTLADEFDAVLVKLHTNYMNLKDKPPAEQWADDTVHPTPWGHEWIAKQWMDAVFPNPS